MTDPAASALPTPAGRILDAALTCIARVGLAKTTLDDVARESGYARATVYRCFPGKRALLAAALQREVDELGARVLAAAAPAETLADAVVAVIEAGAETFRTHPALGFLLVHEPGLIASQLSFERGSATLRAASDLVGPAFTRFLPEASAARLAEWVTRLTLSYLCNPTDHGQLDDPAFVRSLVLDYVLPGFVRTGLNSSVTARQGAPQ